jgi:hypothetical protein
MKLARENQTGHWLSVNHAFFMQNLLSFNTANQQKIPHPQCLTLGGDYKTLILDQVMLNLTPLALKGGFRLGDYRYNS